MESKKNKILFLDGLRGIAALYVMIGHARWLLWEGFTNGYNKHPESYTFIEKYYAYFISLFKFGYNFVLLFFVLSGFVIHYSVQKSKENPNFKWQTYFYRRLKRIYPPFLFALVLTFVIDFFGAYILNLDFYKNGSAYSPFTLNIQNTSLQTFIGNMFFLMKSYVPIFGSNESSWSLSYEWWFYMIYPLFYILFRNKLIFSTIAIIIISVCLRYIHIPNFQLINDVFFFLPVWWVGVVLAELYMRKASYHLKYFIVLIPILLYFAAINYTKYNYLSNIFWALSFAGLIGLLFNLKPTSIVIKALSKLKWLGDISYTLYIIHLPFLFLFHAILLQLNNNLLPKSFIYFHISIPLMIFISYFVSKVVEKPFK